MSLVRRSEDAAVLVLTAEAVNGLKSSMKRGTIAKPLVDEIFEWLATVLVRASVQGTTKVAAAVLTADGRVYAGVNTDGVIRGNSVCAELAARASARPMGHEHFVAVFVLGARIMCGNCYQEFSHCGRRCMRTKGGLRVFYRYGNGKQVRRSYPIGKHPPPVWRKPKTRVFKLRAVETAAS